MNDLIKREDAIKVVDSYIGTDPIVEKLKDIPSAEPKKVCIGQIHFLENIDTRHRWLLMSGTEVEDWFVLAWMPLPEPWGGADNDAD